jgi:anhydro-N-acetylmuramic acid kinase
VRKAVLRVIGLMSGTSLDGVDAAWIETDGERIGAFGPTITVPYDDELREILRQLLDRAPDLDPADPLLKEAEQGVTEYHARAVASIGGPAELVGFHGQTILHDPARGRTWQIGDPVLLARLTRVAVAYDFRSADVAADGQGAPLAPVYHAALARELKKPVAVLNIGGVANVTWIGEGRLVAFDTGPGNGPLDDWIERHTGRRFDRNGLLARDGVVHEPVLRRLMAHPYFVRSGPKSLDRLEFSQVITTSGLDALSLTDGAATLVAFTAASVAAARLPEAPRHWLVCGGGRRNPVMMEALRERLAVEVTPVEAVGWNGDALEAQCFGFLAARVAAGLPLSFPETTGVPRPMRGGRIVQLPGVDGAPVILKREINQKDIQT